MTERKLKELDWPTITEYEYNKLERENSELKKRIINAGKKEMVVHDFDEVKFKADLKQFEDWLESMRSKCDNRMCCVFCGADGGCDCFRATVKIIKKFRSLGLESEKND